MEFTAEEMLQLLEMLQVPEEAEIKCKKQAAQGDFEGIYRYLRSIRAEFLEKLHLSQNRLDLLDYLIHEVKKKKENEVCKS